MTSPFRWNRRLLVPFIQTKRLRQHLFNQEAYDPVESHFNGSTVQALLGDLDSRAFVIGDVNCDWLHADVELVLEQEYGFRAPECAFTWDCQCPTCVKLGLD